MRAVVHAAVLIAIAAGLLATPAAAAKAPPVSGTTLDGKRLSLDDFRGRTTYVVVWASW